MRPVVLKDGHLSIQWAINRLTTGHVRVLRLCPVYGAPPSLDRSFAGPIGQLNHLQRRTSVPTGVRPTRILCLLSGSNHPFHLPSRAVCFNVPFLSVSRSLHVTVTHDRMTFVSLALWLRRRQANHVRSHSIIPPNSLMNQEQFPVHPGRRLFSLRANGLIIPSHPRPRLFRPFRFRTVIRSVSRTVRHVHVFRFTFYALSDHCRTRAGTKALVCLSFCRN